MAPNAPNFRTIVVATDFSRNAGVAIGWAAELARLHGALLVLVHAFRTEPPEFIQWPVKHHDDIRASVKSQLEREADAIRAGGGNVECVFDVGAPAQVILATAERRRADLIVAGTRGHTGWKKLLLGSTAARLLHSARCPVLTVQPKVVRRPRPVRTVLVPTDFSRDAALAAELATRVLAPAAVARRIVLLHAYHLPYEASYLPPAVCLDAITALDTKMKRMIEECAAKLRAGGVTVDAIACDNDPLSAILHHARSTGAELIAMGTHGASEIDRLIAGSTAERVVAAAPCPVLTVRAESV